MIGSDWIACLGSRRVLTFAFAVTFTFAGGQSLYAQNVAWTMVVIPDTQLYNNPSKWPIFNQMTQWIVDNKESRNIQVVLHEGDITDQNTAVQWEAAAGAMGRLNGEVPYILATGNHDVFRTGTLINDYFSVSDNPLNTSPTGIMMTERVPGEIENTYSTFTAPDGREMLIFSLEFLPRAEVVEWANGIAALPEYQYHTAVLLTHHYLEEGPALGGQPTPNLTGSGQYLWKEFVDEHRSFELTFNGHSLDKNDADPYGPLTTARQSFIGENGNTVHSMVFNSQQQPNGGNGYMRLVEFLDDGSSIQVRTYSPYLDLWLTDTNNQFQLELTSLYAGDFNDDGVVDIEDYVVWSENLGTTNVLPNDPTPGIVDVSDFGVWNSNSGNTIYAGDFNNDGTVNDHDYDVWLAHAGTQAVLPNDPTPGFVDHRDLVQLQNHHGRSKYESYYNGFYGDFNGDGNVDGADYTVWSDNRDTNAILYNDPTIGVVDDSDFELWRVNFGSTVFLGDFNDDRSVDGADYTLWRDNLGTNVVFPNDPTPGVVDESDFELWRAHFGNETGLGLPRYPLNAAPWASDFGLGAGAASAVPEPSAGALSLGLPMFVLAFRRRMHFRRAFQCWRRTVPL